MKDYRFQKQCSTGTWQDSNVPPVNTLRKAIELAKYISKITGCPYRVIETKSTIVWPKSSKHQRVIK